MLRQMNYLSDLSRFVGGAVHGMQIGEHAEKGQVEEEQNS